MKRWRTVTGLERTALADCVTAGCRTVPNQRLQEKERQNTITGRKVLVMALLAGLIVKIFYSMDFSTFAQTGSETETDKDYLGTSFTESRVPEYREYVERFPERYPEEEIRIGAEACVHYEENEISREPFLCQNYEGMPGDSIYTEAGSMAEFTICVEEEGFYDLSLEYYPAEGSHSSIARSILIDGELPYREMSRVNYDRIWEPVVDTGQRTDGSSNQYTTETVRQGDAGKVQMEEVEEWITSYSYDRTRYISEPLAVYLTVGEHTITLCALEEPMLIHQIVFSNQKPVQEYSKVKRFWDAVGIRAVSGQPIRIEAENVVRTSSRTLYPTQRRMPLGAFSIVSKGVPDAAVDGVSWQEAGQWIEWEFEVKEAGYYNIALYDCQNYVKDADVCRKVMIDGVVPFEEMECYGFRYQWGWRKDVLSDDEGTPYVFYLKQGRHTLHMETMAGESGGVSFPLTIDCIEIVPAEHEIFQ